MNIVCLGDSLTEGDYGIKGKRGIANVRKESYPYFLGRLLGEAVLNCGKCGFRSSTYLKYYDEGHVYLKDADVVIILLGSNGGQSATEDTEDNRCYVELINRVKRDAPQAKIILMTPPNATVNPEYSNCGYMPQVREAQEFVRKTAETMGLELIDLAKNGCFTPEHEQVYQPNDGLHFGFMGYAKLAEIVYQRIAPLREAPYHTNSINDKIKLVAHRGLSGIECENTAAAFIAAGNRGYYGIETDVWKTRDGQFVCCHDNHTGRICREDLNIPSSDFDALRRLHYNDVDRQTELGYLGLPTLQEYVHICKKYGKHCVAELKADFTAEDIRAILDIFAQEKWLAHTTFIAFNIANLDLVRKIIPDQSCQLLAMKYDYTPEWIEMLAKHGYDLDMEYSAVTKELIDRLHAQGIAVNVWTNDNPAVAAYLVECGVDFITTNILEN